MQLKSGDNFVDIYRDNVRVDWIESQLSGVKLGTYAIISSSPGFLAGIVSDTNKNTTIELGEIFERAILKATSLGLGTCWMGGSYNNKDFNKHINLLENEIIAVVSPIGYPATKTKKRDKFMQFVTKSHSRKSWSEIFFDKSWDIQLTKEKSGNLKDLLELIRIAPSSSNKQPWRLIKQDNTLHLYVHKPSSITFRGFTTGFNDLGIIKSHINLSSESLGINGEWNNNEPKHLIQKNLE